jgi:glycosyltransferase involved in cell wall biosynthesis
MRVTHLAPSAQLGGAENVILACIAVGDGWPGAESSLVALGSGPLLMAAESLGARASFVEPPASLTSLGDSFANAGSVLRGLVPVATALPRFVRLFSRTVSALLPQVIHSHGIKTHVLGALLPRSVPVVWHVHDYLGSRAVSSRLLRLLARRCALVIAVSESVAEDARQCLPATVPVVVVHNAVDCDRFSPDGPALDLDRVCGLPPAAPGTVRIGMPATFARWKGHETFLRAIAQLRGQPVRAYVIGGALYRTQSSQWLESELREMAATLRLSDRIGFSGFLDDMPAAYRGLDIVVHASTRAEPFGLVIAEAMACGRAVVAAPTGGARELFTDGEHALSAPSADVEALAAALSKLVSSPQERTALGKRARAHVLASFNRDRFSSALHTALSQLDLRPS